MHTHIACTDNLKEVEPRTSGSFLPRTLDNLEEVEPCLTAGGSPKGNTCGLSRLPSPPSTSKRLIYSQSEMKCEKSFVMLSAHFQWKLHSIMTGIVILSASEGSRRHPRGCEILPPYSRQNDKRVKDNPSLVTK